MQSMYFDFPAPAKEVGFTDSQLSQLCRAIRREFPQDDMLYELHVLRAILAVKAKRITIEQALQEEEKQHA